MVSVVVHSCELPVLSRTETCKTIVKSLVAFCYKRNVMVVSTALQRCLNLGSSCCRVSVCILAISLNIESNTVRCAVRNKKMTELDRTLPRVCYWRLILEMYSISTCVRRCSVVSIDKSSCFYITDFVISNHGSVGTLNLLETVKINLLLCVRADIRTQKHTHK